MLISLGEANGEIIAAGEWLDYTKAKGEIILIEPNVNRVASRRIRD